MEQTLDPHAPYCDLHTHTTDSDGALTPRELVRAASANRIGFLAITDHDRLVTEDELRQLKGEAERPIRLVSGAEISCTYKTRRSGKVLRNVHVLVLGYEPSRSPALERVVKRNTSFDRRLYVNQILDKLRSQGIDLGTCEELAARYPTGHLGRMVLAREMVRRGFADTVDESFDIFLSQHGEKRAYVKNSFEYVELETLIQAVHEDDGGLPILAHLYYYAELDEEEREELVERFAELATAGGRPAGLEALYGRYNASQRQRLIQRAWRFALLPTAGSDFHHSADRLDHGFPGSVFHGLNQAYEQFYGKKMWTI